MSDSIHVLMSSYVFSRVLSLWDIFLIIFFCFCFHSTAIIFLAVYWMVMGHEMQYVRCRSFCAFWLEVTGSGGNCIKWLK